MQAFTWEDDRVAWKAEGVLSFGARAEIARQSGQTVGSIDNRLPYLRNIRDKADIAVSTDQISLIDSLHSDIWNTYVNRHPPLHATISKSTVLKIAEELKTEYEELLYPICRIRDIKHFLYFAGIHEDIDESAGCRVGKRYTYDELRTLYEYQHAPYKPSSREDLATQMKRSRIGIDSQLEVMALWAREAEAALQEGVNLASAADNFLWDRYCTLVGEIFTPLAIVVHSSVVHQLATELQGSFVQVQLRLSLIRRLKKILYIAGIHDDNEESPRKDLVPDSASRFRELSYYTVNDMDLSDSSPDCAGGCEGQSTCSTEGWGSLERAISDADALLYTLEEELTTEVAVTNTVRDSIYDIIGVLEEEDALRCQVRDNLACLVTRIEDDACATALCRDTAIATMLDIVNSVERYAAVCEVLSDVILQVVTNDMMPDVVNDSDIADFFLITSSEPSQSDSEAIMQPSVPYTEQEDSIIWNACLAIDPTHPHAEVYLRLTLANQIHRTPDEISKRVHQLQVLYAEASSAVDSGVTLLPGPSLLRWHQYCALSDGLRRNSCFIDPAIVNLLTLQNHTSRSELFELLQEIRLLKWFLLMSGIHNEATQTAKYPTSSQPVTIKQEPSSASSKVKVIFREEKEEADAFQDAPWFACSLAFKLEEEGEIWRAYLEHQVHDTRLLPARLTDLARHLGCSFAQIRAHLSSLISLQLGLTAQQHSAGRPFTADEDAVIYTQLTGSAPNTSANLLKQTSQQVHCTLAAVAGRYRQLKTLDVLERVRQSVAAAAAHYPEAPSTVLSKRTSSDLAVREVTADNDKRIKSESYACVN